jgi:hypothetical protein
MVCGFAPLEKVSFDGILDHRPEFLPGVSSRDNAFGQAHGGVAVANNEFARSLRAKELLASVDLS